MKPPDGNLRSSALVSASHSPTMDRPGADALARRIRPRTREEIQDWFLSYLAPALQTTPDEIDVKAPFELLGLDSVAAVGMSGDLQDWLGFPIDPMVVYDYPTIEALAGHLAECSRSARPAA